MKPVSILALCLIATLGCGGTSGPGPIPDIQVTPASVTIPQNTQAQLTASVTGAKWTSDPATGAVSVDASGLVGVANMAAGSATVTATHPTDTRAFSRCAITLIAGPQPQHEVTGSGEIGVKHRFWIQDPIVPGATNTYTWTVQKPAQVNIVRSESGDTMEFTTYSGTAIDVSLTISFSNCLKPMTVGWKGQW